MARPRFALDQKPDGGHFDDHKKFNNGRPDVVFMRYTGTPVEIRRRPLGGQLGCGCCGRDAPPPLPGQSAPLMRLRPIATLDRLAADSERRKRAPEMWFAPDGDVPSGRLRRVIL